ncbi:MAG: hypothetical protein IKR91_07530, partial [Alloprevotella sp.]|nr:hypothetical protein [Alloprevotella sp.]
NFRITQSNFKIQQRNSEIPQRNFHVSEAKNRGKVARIFKNQTKIRALILYQPKNQTFLQIAKNGHFSDQNFRR